MIQNVKENPKISVVIPVYNAEIYIPHCIESLKAQTLKDLEFIFVDDRSPDESMRAVEEWSDTDPRVRILRNEVNLGEGGSRNRGIEAARGLYVNNIDPDDWVAPDYYELLWSKATETSADMVKGTRIKISEETYKELKPESDLNTTITASLAKGRPLYLSLTFEHQTVLFKRTLLTEQIKYGRSANAADTTFLLELCSVPATFVTENRARYYYLQRKTSATGGYSLRRSLNELISFREQIEHFLREGCTDKYVYLYCSRTYAAYISRFISACETENIPIDKKKEYLLDMRAQLARLPGCDHLHAVDPMIMALDENDGIKRYEKLAFSRVPYMKRTNRIRRILRAIKHRIYP